VPEAIAVNRENGGARLKSRVLSRLLETNTIATRFWYHQSSIVFFWLNCRRVIIDRAPAVVKMRGQIGN
jgi:hypothetical protein